MPKRHKPNLELRKKFGANARQLRKVMKVSQDELGDIAGIDRTYIGAVERGEQNISLDNIGRLAKALKVSLDELFRK